MLANKTPIARAPSRQDGIALLEGLIAILLFSMGILAIMGLQAAAIRNTADSRDRVVAGFVANQTIGQMWVDRGNLASYAATTAVSSLPNGQQTVAVSGNQVTVTITWQPPNASQHSYVAIAQINGS